MQAEWPCNQHPIKHFMSYEQAYNSFEVPEEACASDRAQKLNARQRLPLQLQGLS